MKLTKCTFIILLLFAWTSNSVGQEFTSDSRCGGVLGAGQFPCVVHYSASTDPEDLKQYEPVVFNIFYWAVNPDSGAPTFYESHALQSVAALNMAFNQFNIFFKYLGYDNTSWNSDEHSLNSEFSDITQAAEALGYKKPNAINFYVPTQYSNGGGGWAGMWSTNCSNNLQSFRNAPHSAVHEVAHCLGLYHTYEKYDYYPCEFVSRDPNDGEDFNADNYGDCVVDTAATSRFHLEGIEDLDMDNCLYVGDGEDCNDPPTPYMIYPEDVMNFMAGGNAEYSGGHCRQLFTIGQGIRMRESIVVADYKFEHAITTVSSLYEPYKGVYGAGWSPQNIPPTFQPGFDYEFRHCSCDNIDDLDCSHPSDFDETGFQSNHSIVAAYPSSHSNYSQIVHPNHSAIRILQLSQFGSRRCYDSWSQPTLGGFLTTFNDGVLNANVTVQPKDSVQLNDKAFIDGLPSGLYKLDEYYQDGSKRQRVIKKGNR